MTRGILLFSIISILSSSFCLSQEYKEEDLPSTFSLLINQDNAFGFYPQVAGSFPINDKLSFSFYSIFWSNGSYGTPEFGTDLWTEVGVGLSFSAFQNKMVINPSLGFTHGKLLSGGEQGVPFDGIVPNALGFVLSGNFEAELFASYYKALRSEGPETYDYLLYWAYPGFILSDHISVGAHYEGFALTRSSSGASGLLYHWLGAYIKFNISDTYTLRFSTGTNLKEGDYSDGFYKLTMFASLN